MKAAILAGGFGTRLTEETAVKPKPMVEIGGRPILWHIMKLYARHGFRDFIIALGYKGEYIKDYFLGYADRHSDLTLDLTSGAVQLHQSRHEDWRVTLVDTGLHTQTGGRLKRLGPYVGDGTFLLTYGDGVANVDLAALTEFHRAHGRLATVTAVHPPARFGALKIEQGRVTEFSEKPEGQEGWINGGFFVLEPGALAYIDGDAAVWERDPLQRLAAAGQLMAYQHEGFWQCMDTLRDVRYLQALAESGRPPWTAD